MTIGEVARRGAAVVLWLPAGYSAVGTMAGARTQEDRGADALAARIAEMKRLLQKSCTCRDLQECGRRLRK